MMIKNILTSLMVIVLLGTGACKSKKNTYKASGQFEAKEIIVSAEAGGRIDELSIEEGSMLHAGQVIGRINCSQQELITKQANESLLILPNKTADASANIKVLEKQKLVQQSQLLILDDQLATLIKEETRIKKLVDAQAVPAKQLDDVRSNKSVMQKQIDVARQQTLVIDEQIKAAYQNTVIQNRAILSEKSPLDARVNQLKDLEKKCIITNPVKGTVLTQYTNVYEMATPGKALYKIANLDTLYLKAYITGNQLPELKLNQGVKIHIHQGDWKEDHTGIVTWISDKAEFTPKSVMTSDERANLVYPIKIKCINNGNLKIGLFAEVNW